MKEERGGSLELAFKTFYNDGLVAENPTIIRRFLYARNDPAHLLVDAQTERILANVRFLGALPREWDIPHGVNPFDQFHIFLSDDFLAMAGMEIAGDHARVPTEELAQEGLHMKVPSWVRIRGKWKLDVTPTPPPASTANLATAIRKYAKVVEQVAAAVQAGALKTIDEVKQALDAAPKFEPTDYTPDLILSLPSKKRGH